MGIKDFLNYINAPVKNKGRLSFHEKSVEELDKKKTPIKKKITIKKKF